MSETKRKVKPMKIVGVVLCVILSLVLIGNMTIIVKGTIDPDTPPGIFGVTSMIVMSGSMSGDAPDHIEVGDMIIARKVDPSTLQIGDVITFMEDKTTITHRIISVNEDGSFITKGDANDSEDLKAVTYEQIIGKFAFRIPKLGDFALFMQTPVGMLVFIGIPLVVYILLDVILRARFHKKEQKLADEKEKDKENMQAEIERLKAQINESKTEE